MISMSVEIIVIPFLGLDNMFFDNSILSAFGRVLDWEKELLLFKGDGTSIAATHQQPHPTASCSATAIDASATSVPLRLNSMCMF